MAAHYTLDRNDTVWLDFEPIKDKEIGKYWPVLVLSSKPHNQQIGLLICCPISTSVRGGPTEVPVKNLEKESVLAASLIQTLSWKDRKASFITKAEKGVMDQVLVRIIPLIGTESVIEKFVE